MTKVLVDTEFNFCNDYVDFTYQVGEDDYYIERYSLEYYGKFDIYGNEIKD